RVEQVVRALRAEAEDAARDRAMLERLEAAQDLRAAISDEDLDRTNPRAVIVFGHGAADGYAETFRAYGIDVLALDPEEAGRQIRQRQRIHVQLAAALDDWLVLDGEQPGAQRLRGVSREADPDPFRNRLRAAVAALDATKLRQLAREAEAKDLPVAASLLLADGLHLAGELGEAVEVLRRARQHHPDDFWIN